MTCQAALQHLGIGGTCAAWAAALKPADAETDPALALKCAQLLAVLATGAAHSTTVLPAQPASKAVHQCAPLGSGQPRLVRA